MAEQQVSIRAKLLGEKVSNCIEVEGRWYSLEIQGNTAQLGILGITEEGRRYSASREDIVSTIRREISSCVRENGNKHPTVYEVIHKAVIPDTK